MNSNNKKQVVITGKGVVLPTGATVEKFWQRLLCSRTAITAFNPIDLKSSFTPYLGQISDDVHTESKNSVPAKLRRFCARPSIWGVKSIALAIENAALQIESVESERRALFTGQGDYTEPSFSTFQELIERITVSGPLDLHTFVNEVLEKRAADPFAAVKSLSNNLFAVASIAYNFRGDCGAFAQNESGAISALKAAHFSISNGYCDVAIVATCGSFREAFTLVEQMQLRFLNHSAAHPESLKAFDQQGAGTILGEGAVALVLESAEHAQKRGANINAVLNGVGTHCSTPGNKSKNNTYYKRCLEKASEFTIDAACVDGRGISESDQHEVQQLKEAFGSNNQALTATKSITGLVSGAAPLVDIVTCLKMLETQVVPPIAYLQNPICSELNFIRNRPQPTACRRVAALCASASGLHSAVVLSAHQ